MFLVISFIGFCLSGMSFALTFLSPLIYEKSARNFIEIRVQEEIEARFEENKKARIKQDQARAEIMSKVKETFIKESEEKIKRHIPALDRTKDFLEERLNLNTDNMKRKALDILPRLVSGVVTKMQDPSQTITRNMMIDRQFSSDVTVNQSTDIQLLLTRLAELDYIEIVRQLLNDLRIFTGTNLIAFSLLLFGGLFQKRTGAQMAVSGSLLLISVILCSLVYLLNQNWLYTLMDNDYVGYSYCGYVGIVFLFLCDLVLNDARISDFIIELVNGYLEWLSAIVPS